MCFAYSFFHMTTQIYTHMCDIYCIYACGGMARVKYWYVREDEKDEFEEKKNILDFCACTLNTSTHRTYIHTLQGYTYGCEKIEIQ